MPTKVGIVMVGITPSTTPSEFKILKYIGFHGTSTGYDLSIKEDPPPVVSDKVAYTLLPRLVKNGFLTVVAKKIGKRLRKEYSLTVLGVSYLLIDRAMPRVLASIIRHWSDIIPRVLGVWSVFQNIDEDILHSALKRAAYETMAYRQIPGIKLSYPSEVISEVDDDVLFTFKFYWDLLFNNVDSGRFLGAIEDPDLRVFLKEFLECQICIYRTMLKTFETNLQTLNK